MPNQLDGLITREDIAGIAASEDLILDDDERISVLEAMHSIDVQACPGSGKTTLIATKLILLAKNWPFEYQGICVLSHTNIAKNEIINRLENSKTPEAQRLLSYPHFIGTIQEFVNRYIALPYLRAQGINDIIVDNDEYIRVARKVLLQKQFIWLIGTLNGLGGSDALDGFLRMTFRFCTENGTEVNISKRPRAWKLHLKYQRAQRALAQLKKHLDHRGCFLFRDMYTHAQVALSENQELQVSIATRFPYVFMDEMQDTQKFQDELLSQLFPLDHPGIIVQRFGDPDQAIFHGIGGEEPNKSFNDKHTEDMNIVINKSHRFDNGIAEKIRNLSFNEVQLKTELSEETLVERTQHSDEGHIFEHSVIIFDDDSIGDVVLTFADTVSNQFSGEYKRSDRFSVKVVGGVGNEIDPESDQLKIGHYWGEYDKAKSKTNFKEDSLIEVVRYCHQSSSSDLAGDYKLLSDCVLKILRMLGKQDKDGKYFSSTSMRDFLKGQDKWRNYRQLIHAVLDRNHQIDLEFWGQVNQVLASIFEINEISVEVTEYLSFSEDEASTDTAQDDGARDEEVLTLLPENMILHSDGFRIELSTIHGVKGETHDATLVLETKNHCFDLGTMMPYLTSELPNDEHPNNKLRESPHWKPKFKSNKKFMRQFYVAMSRPKHLLCLAVHSDRITDKQKQELHKLGWSVKELPTSKPET